MPDLPTRNKAQAYLNYLRDIRGDLCIESCVHSVATNTAEHCLEAYVDGRLIDGQAIADAYQATLDEAPYLNTGGVPRLLRVEAPELAALLDALTEEGQR